MSINAGTALDQELRAPADPAALELLPPLGLPSRAQPTAWPHAKRVADVVFAVLLLVVLSPLIALIALAIRLDSSGPVLFRQQRVGRGRERFTVLKFRTMHDGVSPAAHRLYIAKLASPDGDGDDGDGLKKLTGDRRVTGVGAFLRRTSLDELPQLVNVVRGQMAIIGPRPALEYELEHYELEHYERFDVRPGLTGLWQVSGRNTIGFLGMLELDAQYARTCSPRVDISILLRTPLALLRGHAA